MVPARRPSFTSRGRVRRYWRVRHGLRAFLDAPEWITPTAAYGMFLLTLAVTPANTYMWTHNAPGPLPENPDESMLSMAPPAHAARGALQVLLLSVCWGLAHPPG